MFEFERYHQTDAPDVTTIGTGSRSVAVATLKSNITMKDTESYRPDQESTINSVH